MSCAGSMLFTSCESTILPSRRTVTPIGDRENLPEQMSNVHDRQTLAAEPAQVSTQLLGLALSDRGRWFVQHKHLWFSVKRFRNLDKLPVADVQLVDQLTALIGRSNCASSAVASRSCLARSMRRPVCSSVPRKMLSATVSDGTRLKCW